MAFYVNKDAYRAAIRAAVASLPKRSGDLPCCLWTNYG
jgi:hypothetical protein